MAASLEAISRQTSPLLPDHNRAQSEFCRVGRDLAIAAIKMLALS